MSYQYTAIGDSLTTGFGALPGNGFVPAYRRMAEERLRSHVVSTNLGVNGMTTAARKCCIPPGAPGSRSDHTVHRRQ
jgi:lysophospholipase L1-like esterase